MLRSSCLAWMLPMKHICYLSYNRSGCSSWILFITVVIQAHASSAGCQSRFSFSFLPKRGQNEIVWAIGGGGKYVFMCKACGKLRASGWGACPGKWWFWTFQFGGIWDCRNTYHHHIPDSLLTTVLISCLLVFFLSIRRMSVNSRAPILAYSASAHGRYEYSYPWLSHARTMAHACLPTVACVSLSRLGAE